MSCLAQGFHRYSTDRQWHIPHFEKMLYDQAQLSVVYSQAFQVTFAPNLNPDYQSQSLPGNCGFLLISTHNSSHILDTRASLPSLSWVTILF